MNEPRQKIKTTEDQMDTSLITLRGLLDLRKLVDGSIENLLSADLSLHNLDKPEAKIVWAKIDVGRAKVLMLEVSKLIEECLEGNI